MVLSFYNTLTRKKEEFAPIKSGVVSMYNCGPTVYDRVHVGNLRAFFLADILKRSLEQNGFNVKQVMNITDVDDKTIKRSRDEDISLSELTEKYTNYFLADLEALNIKKPSVMPKATENIELMTKLIESLLDKGFAYKSEDGVYFSIDKSENYGALIGLEKNSLENKSQSRVKNDEYDKDNPHDFALWKFRTKEDGEVFWKAPFGDGRPGWHIECSAMSMNALGESFDIHTGGIDLIFPHHENEIAQSEGATGKKFVNFWIHNNHILVNGEKMSKSSGNVFTLSDLHNKELPPLSYRYLLLTSHYRTLLNFTWESLSGANNAYQKLLNFMSEWPSGGKIDLAYKAKFEDFIGDDLDTPKALALAWELVRDQEVATADKKATILYFDEIFGLKLENTQDEKIPENIMGLAQKREEARKNKDWDLSDKLRAEIESMGYELKDTETGPKIKKVQ